MKKWMKLEYTPCLMILLGLFAMGLRALTYMMAVDEKNLMIANHPLELSLYGLTLLVLLLSAGLAWPLKGTKEFSENYPASPLSAGGSLLMGLGIGLTLIFWEPGMGGMMGRIWMGLGIVAALSLGWIGYCRLVGKKPWSLFHFFVILFFGIHMVTHYQTWSKVGYLPAYFFPLLGGVSLVLFAYEQTAFDAGLGRRRILLGLGLLSMFLCTAALSHCGYWVLYGCGIFWVWSNLVQWHVSPEPEKPKEEKAEEGETP